MNTTRRFLAFVACLSVSLGVVIGQEISLVLIQILEVAKGSDLVGFKAFTIVVGMQGALVGFYPALRLLSYKSDAIKLSRAWLSIALITLAALLISPQPLFGMAIYIALSIICGLTLLMLHQQTMTAQYHVLCKIQARLWANLTHEIDRL